MEYPELNPLRYKSGRVTHLCSPEYALLWCFLTDLPSFEIVMMLISVYSAIWDCYDVHFRSFRHARLLWRSLPFFPQYEIVIILNSVIPSCKIVTMFTSGHFVTRDCYDVLFWSIHHVRSLWCSVPVSWSSEIVMVFTSGHFVTRDCYDVLFRSFHHVRSL